MARIDEQLIDARVTAVGNPRPLGYVTMTLPDLTPAGVDVRGGGILGTYSSKGWGAFESHQFSMTFRSISQDLTFLMTPHEHVLTVRAAQQTLEGGTGRSGVAAMRYVLRGRFATANLGELSPNEEANTQIDIEPTMLKIFRDGREIFALDKLNGVYRVNGVDMMAEVEAALGG